MIYFAEPSPHDDDPDDDADRYEVIDDEPADKLELFRERREGKM